MDSNWKKSLESRRSNPVLQHYDHKRDEQCFNREYLIRRLRLPIPDSVHAWLSWQSYVADQALSQEHSKRMPRLEIPGVSALTPWLRSLVVEEKEYLCFKCRKIDFEAVFGGLSTFELFTLPYPGIHSPGDHQCVLCSLLRDVTFILAVDPEPWASHGPGDWTLDVTKDELVLYHGGTCRGQIRLEEDQVTGIDEAAPSINNKSKPVDKNEISADGRGKLDVSRIRNWLAECELQHEGLCRNPWKGPRYREPIDLILIDVQAERLVRAKSDERFVALSYVWGNSTTLQTKVANFEALQQHHVLSPANELVARVVRDTMKLVKEIGERYVWADTLCIVQDDLEGKTDAIRNMDIVYGHALLTIIAASGQNADEGLPGVGTEVRPLLGLRRAIKGFPLIWRGPELSDMARYSRYEDRAWTMQEKLLSRRCLYISRHQAYFHCCSDYNCEDYHSKSFWEKSHDRGQSMPFPENPLYTMQDYPLVDTRGEMFTWSYCIYVYMSLVSIYTSRQLSFHSDVINAFQGILGVLGDASGGPFVYALPDDVFDLALLWVPGRDTGVKRRTEGNFPSWSWVGWSGVATYKEHFPVHVQGQPPDGEPFPPNEDKFRDLRTTVEQHLTRDELLTCRNHEFKFRSEVKFFAIEDGESFENIKRSGAGTLYEVVTENRTPPVPVLDSTFHMALSIPRPPILHFPADTIATTSFTLIDGFPSDRRPVQYPGQTIVYINGKQCGQLFQGYDAFDGLTGKNSRVREFVLLSRLPGCTDSTYVSWFDRDLGSEGWFICNVMLIERDLFRDWAERICTGVVHARVWDAQEVVTQMIRLG
jgi:hypothetical protein